MTPYVGITGVNSREQAGVLAGQFIRAGFCLGAAYQGHIGYCLTTDMMCGTEPVTPRYIELPRLPEALNPDQSFGRNVIHFSPRPKSHAALISDLERIFLQNGVYDSGLCRVLQLNHGLSVAPHSVAAVKKLMPDLGVIFQVGPDEHCLSDQNELAARLYEYSDSVDAFLIDPSQGRGREIEVSAWSSLVRALEQNLSEKHLVFAGGLGPENIGQKIIQIGTMTAVSFSVDAESGVRDSADALDFSKTQSYITQAASALALV